MTNMTEFGEVLQNAIDDKKTDINQFVWIYQNGKSSRLMDMDETELSKCYNHCYDMLWNEKSYIPGKYVIRKNIAKIYEDCNAELFLRYLLHDIDTDLTNIKTNKDLLEFINNNKKINNITNSDYISSIFNAVPVIFEKITIEKLVLACLDKLDVLNRKLISDKFIISQGIWLTDKEKEELTEYDNNGKLRNRLDVIKERLILNPDVKLRTDPNGLTLKEFRSLIHLSSLPKISSSPTDTLKLLRDKILLLLDNDLNYHINKWTNLLNQIKDVAKYKNIEIKWHES